MPSILTLLLVLSILVAHSHVLSIMTKEQSSTLNWFCSVSKAVPVVLLAVASLAKGSVRSSIRVWTFLALVFAAIGDVLLLDSSEEALMQGTIAFLISHVFYILKFTTLNRSFSPAIALVYSLIASIILYTVWPYVPQTMIIHVAIYTSIITLMAERAFEGAGKLGCVGGVLFVLSDYILVTNQFRWTTTNEVVHGFQTTDPEFQKYVRVAVMITYYTAHFLLNHDIFRASPPKRPVHTHAAKSEPSRPKRHPSAKVE